MDIVITTFCNLYCSKCANLTPLHKNCGKFYELEQLKKDISTLFKNYQPSHVNVLGGETFLSPIWKDLVIFLEQYDIDIYVYTNGTIVPNDFNGITRAHFIIDDYPKSTKVKELCQAISKAGLTYNILDCHWYEHGDLINYGKSYFYNCPEKTITLLEGRIYLCERAAHADILDKVKSPSFSVESFREDSFDNINDMEICKYCLVGSEYYVPIQRGDK